MAQTNVQAFSGDVAISSNLAVDTNTLFVDSVGNKVGIGLTNPVYPLHISTTGDGDSVFNLVIDQRNNATVYYRKIAYVINNNGHAIIRGSMGSHGQSGGNGFIDVKFAIRDGFTALGSCYGTINNTNIIVKQNDDYSRRDIYLVTGSYSLANLQITTTHGCGIFGDSENQPTSTPPSGTTTHDLKEDFKTFRVDDDGNVGIGTTNPLTKLHVVGDVAISSNLAVDTNTLFVDSVGNKVGIGTDAPGYRLDLGGDSSDSRLGFGTNVTLDNNRGIYWANDVNYAIYRDDGAWSSPNYAQLRIRFATGIVLDAGSSAYGRSYVGVKNSMAIGSSYHNSNTKPPTDGLIVQGNVGIGTASPGAKLHVKGGAIHITNVDTAVAQIAAFGVEQGTGQLYVGQSGTYGGGIEYNGDNIPEQTGAGADYITLYRLDNSAFAWTARNLYSSNQWEFRTAINNSDDRVKENETYIRGATGTLMKIKPQLYDKKPSIESTDTKEWLCESGLIAQELYYDVPELRHLVKIPRDARDIDANVSITSADPTVDPDYSAWGKDTSAVNYIGLVPYLIKSVQEITTELPRHKTRVSNITPQNVEDFVGMIVSKRGSVELSTKSEDKACYGVISEINCDTQNNEVLVNSSGEGKIWITNLTGNVEAGDLITTSNIAGYGQLQNSPVLSNFTVAKLTEDCDFNPSSTPVRRIRQEMSNVTVYSVSREVRVTEEEYNELTEEDRTTENRITYFDGENQIELDTYSNMESNTLRTETTLVFKLIHRHTSKTMREGYTPEVRQELVNVLDEHGQIQWEDDPSGATEKAYKIRYLDADGVETDEVSAVHKAAFVGCTYHCG